jgi:Kef-type K+ transport system membrane component KefB
MSVLAWTALVVLAALLAGEALERWLRLPRLLGWILAGVFLGRHGAGLLAGSPLVELRPVLELAAGAVLFQLGQRVDPLWLARNPWLLFTSLVEAALTFFAVFAALAALGVPFGDGALAAAIGVATAPAVVLTLATELRSQGQVTERMLLLTALNGIYALVASSVLAAWLSGAPSVQTILLHPLYLVLGSAALAAAFAAGTLVLLRLLGRRDEAQFIAVLGLVALAVWAAARLELSLLLTLLAYGVLTRLFDRRRRFVSLSFGRMGTLLLILLFALTAAALELPLAWSAIASGAAVVAARISAKLVSVAALALPSGLPVGKAAYLGLALTPMSGVALLVLHEAGARVPQAAFTAASAMVAAVALLELAGPLFAYWALVRSGEAERGRR